MEKEVDREQDGEMTSGFMQEQHGPELQETERNSVYMRRDIHHRMNTALMMMMNT